MQECSPQAPSGLKEQLATNKILLIQFFILLLLPLLCYSPQLSEQFHYDDISHLEQNPSYLEIKSFKDSLHFSLQKTRPWSNLTLGFIQQAVGLRSQSHQMISVLLHGWVSGVLFLLLLHLGKSTADSDLLRVAWVVALLFAVIPVASETLLVSVFRWEIWGTLCTLGLLLCCLRFECSKRQAQAFCLLGIFVAGLIAFLSKESYLVMAFSTLLGVYFHCFQRRPDRFSAKRLRPLIMALVLLFFTGSLLLMFLFQQQSEFGYDKILGGSVFTPTQHLVYGHSSFLEQMAKTLLNYPLSFLRLTSRFSLASGLPPWAHLVLIAFEVGLIMFLWKKFFWLRPWMFIFLSASLFYVFIPNINIGSEHYYYYPSWVLLVMLCLGVVHVLRHYGFEKYITPAFILIGVFFLTGLQARLGQTRNRITEAISLTQQHPESPVSWASLGAAMMEHPQRLEEAYGYFKKALSIDPHLTQALSGKLQYLLLKKDWTQADTFLQSFVRTQTLNLRQTSYLYYNFSEHLFKSGDCLGAVEKLKKALAFSPHNPFFTQSLSRVEAEMKARSKRCERN